LNYRRLGPAVAVRDEKGEQMVVVPLNQAEKEARIARPILGSVDTNWALYAAGGGLLAGGLLLLTGNRRAGLITAASGTALALLDQQETVREWWNAMPAYIDKAQHLLGKLEEGVAEIAQQRERLHRILTQ
jgi:hypothetical protein